MRELDYVVIGAGVIGSATAWRLAGWGRSVVLLEQFEVGHKRGSSHGASRIFRLSYDDPLYVGMAMEALPLWRELERESGREILATLGGLDFGADLTRHVSALEASGAPFELLDASEVAKRFPDLRPAWDGSVLFHPDGGILAADLAVRTFVDAAVGRGVELRERTPVMEVRVAGDRAEVRTKDDTYSASAAVVAAGAWAKGLLAGAGIDLPVTPSRETVAYFRVERELSLPTIVDWGNPLVYALPSPGQGIKVGVHHGGPDTDPDEEGDVSVQTVEIVSGWVRDHYTTADARPHHAETCLYMNTVDEHFIVERHGPIVVGSACSGHGFKFAPVTGDRLARLATED
jgi:sarcosine oxidase